MRGWRKYSVAAGALVLGFILALVGKLTSQYVQLAGLVVGAFNLAHAASDVAGAMNWKPDKP